MAILTLANPIEPKSLRRLAQDVLRSAGASFIRILKDPVRNSLAEVLTRARVLPYRFGIDPLQDIEKRLKHQNIRTVFDVGANRGDTALAFRKKYPTAKIYCFEPNPELLGALKGLGAQLHVHTLAFSSKAGEAGFDRSRATPDLFSLTDDMSGEIVRLETVDGFCSSGSIDHVNFLKIDTEGHDLEVLRGAITMLARGAIDIVQAEVSMNPDNKHHISFFELQNFLQHYGYRIFGIYEQINEWPTREPHMRRANIVWISNLVIKANQALSDPIA
jgi:FkbM family methyltransferase